MLTEQFRHDPKSTTVFLTVALLHALLLYLLSMKGGLWIKPPHDTQPLTVSFVTERATANKASKKDTLDTSRNAQKQKRISKRSPETQRSTQKVIQKKTEKAEPTQRKVILSAEQATKPVQTKAENVNPTIENPLNTKDITQDKQAQKNVDTSSNSNKAAKNKEPLESKPNNKSFGKPSIEPFSQHVDPQYQAVINPPNTNKPEKTESKADAEYDEYEAAVKNILDDVDEFTTDDAGQTKANAKKDSSWGKLHSPEDSHVEALYKNRVQAVYPEEELAVEREGIVVFEFQIDRQGKAIEDSINVVNSTTDNFFREALVALLASEFEVTLKNGVLINQNVKVSITFSLDEFVGDDESFP